MDGTQASPPGDRLIQPREASVRLGVSPPTLRRWHAAGLITAQRTLCGHRRYLESEIRALAAGAGVPA